MNATVKRYDKIAIILHWLTGLLILGMVVLGYWMHELPKEVKVDALDVFNLGLYTVHFQEPTSLRTFYFNLHKSIGVTLLALILFRVYWRLTHVAPEFPATMKAWEQKLAEVAHRALYLLMLVVPLSGVTMSVYSKFGLSCFGVALVKGLDNAALRDAFKEVHEVSVALLLTLIVLHVLSAIKHKVVDKDEVMQRMSLH